MTKSFGPRPGRRAPSSDFRTRARISAPQGPPDDARSTIAAAHRPFREILDAYGIVPRKRHGQNFLHDPAVAARIVRAASLESGDVALEIGPGLGAITRPMLETGARVTAIEIDGRLAVYLRETFGDEPRFDLREGDALEFAWEEVVGAPFTLVANLPYSITGPILDRLLRHAPRIRRAVIMVQKEVATRLAAGAGGKEIGAPSVLVRLLYRVERLFDVGSGAFSPSPEIVSTVLRLEPRAEGTLRPGLREAVNRAYLHRRKMIRKTLAGPSASESVIEAALVAIGHAANARPEELEPDAWPLLLAKIDETASS